MIFAARNCMLLSKSSLTLEDVSQAPQQCEIEGQRTEFYSASPNSTRLKFPCSARIRNMKLILLSILSLIYVWTWSFDFRVLVTYTPKYLYSFFSWIQLSPNFHTFSLPTTITLDLVSNIVLSYCSELPIKVTSSAKSSELINWFETWTPTPALYKEKMEYLKCEKYVYNQNNCCEMYSYLDKHSSRKQSSWYTE